MAETTDTDTQGAPDARSLARRAATIDLVLSVVATMLLWPFPVMRRLLSAPAHVGLVIASIVVVGGLMHFWMVRWKALTPGMYFAGQRVESVPSSGVLALWSGLRALLLLPAAIVPAIADPVTGPVTRLTGVRVVSE